MKIEEINPFVRAAQIQPEVLEGKEPRLAYDYRIFLVLDGLGSFYYKGKVFEIKEGSLLVFPPETEYYFKGKLKVIVINFDMTRKYKNEIKPMEPKPLREFKKELVYDKTTAEGFEALYIGDVEEEIREKLLDITESFIFGGEDFDAICSANLKLVLAELISGEKNRLDFKSRLSQKIMFYVRSNAAEILSNFDVGSALGYHPNYLTAVLRETSGKTLHDVILEEKIRLAKLWLSSTDETIENIAFEVGFSTRNYFCTVFKKLTGETPRNYRNKKATQ